MTKPGLLRQAAQAIAQLARGSTSRMRPPPSANPLQAHALHTRAPAAAVETELQQDLKRKHLRSARPPQPASDVAVTMALSMRDGHAAFVVDPVTGERRAVLCADTHGPEMAVVAPSQTGHSAIRPSSAAPSQPGHTAIVDSRAAAPSQPDHTAIVDNKAGAFEDDQEQWNIAGSPDNRIAGDAGNAAAGAGPEDGTAMGTVEPRPNGTFASGPSAEHRGQGWTGDQQQQDRSALSDHDRASQSSQPSMDSQPAAAEGETTAAGGETVAGEYHTPARAVLDATSAFTLTSSQRHTMQDPSAPGQQSRPSPQTRPDMQPGAKPWPQATSTYTGPAPSPDLAPTRPQPTELSEYPEPPSALADTLLAPATPNPDDGPASGFLESYPYSAPQMADLFEPPVDQTEVPGVRPPQQPMSEMVSDPRARKYLEQGASSAEDIFKATTEIVRRIVKSAHVGPTADESVTLLPERVFTTHLLQSDGSDGQRSYTVRVNVDGLHAMPGTASPGLVRAVERAAAMAVRVVRDANPTWAADIELNPGAAVQIRTSAGTSMLHFAAEALPNENTPTPLIVLRTCPVEAHAELDKRVHCMPVVLTYDSAVMEEAIAAQLLAAFKAFLELPETLQGSAGDDGLPPLHPKTA